MKINKRFQDYLNEKNFWPKYKGEPTIEFPLTQENVDYLGNCLESDLSPENLCCDGEIPYAKAKARGNKLRGVIKDLEKYCDSNNLFYPKFYY